MSARSCRSCSSACGRPWWTRAVADRAVAPGHLAHPLCQGLAALRPGEATAVARALVDPAAPRPRPAVDPDELGRGPPAGGRGATWSSSPAGPRWPRTGPWWPGRPGLWPGRCPGPGSCPPCGGATSTAPSTWAWPRAAARPGEPRRRAATGSPDGLGFGPGGPGTRHRGHPRARRPGCRRRPRGPHAHRAGRRSAGRLPRSPLAERALDGAEFVVAVDIVARRRDRAGRRGPAGGRSPRAPGTTTNIEGRVSRLGQKLVPPGQAWPDWMIAAELAVAPRRRPRPRLGRATSGTRSSGWPRPTGGSPAPCSTPRARPTGWSSR